MIIQSQLFLSCSEGEWNPAWQELGHPAPACVNDRASKAFELFIPELDKEVDMASDLARAMFAARPGETAPEAEAHEAPGTPTRQLPSRHPADSHQAIAQVTAEVTAEVTAQVVRYCRESRFSREIMGQLGLRHWKTFQSNYLQPLLDADLLEMTIPDKPRSSKQKYRLTAKGKEHLRGPGADANPGAGGAS